MNKKPYRPGPKRPSNATRPKGRNRQMGGKKEDTNLINDEIRDSEVRLVGDNVEQGIYPIEEALKIAEGQGLDLILIAPQAEPPVCRVMDYQKFKFQQRKHAKEQKAKSTKLVVKEIRFGPQTESSSRDVPSCSRNRARCCCSGSPTTWKNMASWTRCQCSRESA